MCNACNLKCCGHDCFEGCGCYPHTCTNVLCGEYCDDCGELLEDCTCDDEHPYGPDCDDYDDENGYVDERRKT